MANFQTAQNPFNAANTHLTSSDIAFWGDYAYVGDYGGFRIFDVSKPSRRSSPTSAATGHRVTRRCSTPMPTATPTRSCCPSTACSPRRQCGAAPVSKSTTTGRYPEGSWEGLRVFDVSDKTEPVQVAAVYQDCGSHTNTLLPAPGGQSMYVLNSSYPLGEGPTCGPLGAQAGRKVNHGVVQVIEVPFADPAAAFEKTELPVVYPGDADGTYKPVSDHGISAPLDDFLGCHDLSSFPDKGMVGAACGEQAQVWDIDEATGLPDTANPRWVHDQPNVDFWHSATFSWDGEVANFIDESFGDGCPTVTTKTAGISKKPRQFKSGNMFFFEANSGELLSEFRNQRTTNDDVEPGGRGQVLLVAPRHPGAGARPLPAGQRVLPRGLVGDRLQQPDQAEGDRVRRPRRDEHMVRVHVPAQVGQGEPHPRVLQRRPEPQLRDRGGAALPRGRLRLHALNADVGDTTLVGFDRLNPQLQERVIDTSLPRARAAANPQTYAKGKAVADGARNRSARHYTK